MRSTSLRSLDPASSASRSFCSIKDSTKSSVHSAVQEDSRNPSARWSTGKGVHSALPYLLELLDSRSHSLLLPDRCRLLQQLRALLSERVVLLPQLLNLGLQESQRGTVRSNLQVESKVIKAKVQYMRQARGCAVQEAALSRLLGLGPAREGLPWSRLTSCCSSAKLLLLGGPTTTSSACKWPQKAQSEVTPSGLGGGVPIMPGPGRKPSPSSQPASVPACALVCCLLWALGKLRFFQGQTGAPACLALRPAVPSPALLALACCWL